MFLPADLHRSRYSAKRGWPVLKHQSRVWQFGHIRGKVYEICQFTFAVKFVGDVGSFDALDSAAVP